MKICSRCKKEKLLDDFNNLNKTKDGKRYECRECQNSANRDYKKINKEKTRVYNKKYKERHNELARKRYGEKLKFDDDYISRQKEHKKRYYSTEKGKKSKQECDKRYRERNKEKIREKNKKNRREPYNLLVESTRSRFRKYIKRGIINCSSSKTDKAKELIGCSLEKYKKYLENKFCDGMKWENYGEWHIDHIKPICLFDLKKEEELKKAFNYKNTQPLWAKDNLSKGAKYDENKIN